SDRCPPAHGGSRIPPPRDRAGRSSSRWPRPHAVRFARSHLRPIFPRCRSCGPIVPEARSPELALDRREHLQRSCGAILPVTPHACLTTAESPSLRSAVLGGCAFLHARAKPTAREGDPPGHVAVIAVAGFDDVCPMI